MKKQIKMTHGGAGRGQGRPRLYEKLERHAVTLQPEHIVYLKKLGGGKLSLGIRLLVEATVTADKKSDC